MYIYSYVYLRLYIYRCILLHNHTIFSLAILVIFITYYFLHFPDKNELLHVMSTVFIILLSSYIVNKSYCADIE